MVFSYVMQCCNQPISPTYIQETAFSLRKLLCSVVLSMADTARSKSETKEFFDSPEELNRKVEVLAELVKKSKHFIVFTVRQLTL